MLHYFPLPLCPRRLSFRVDHFLVYPVPDDVSRARSLARACRRARSIPVVTGCALPSTRRAIRPMSSSVVTASRRSSSVAPGSK